MESRIGVHLTGKKGGRGMSIGDTDGKGLALLQSELERLRGAG